MAFSDFSQSRAIKQFGLSTVEGNWFGSVPPVEPSARLRETLELYYPIAKAISTEKAISEMLITPILMEVRLALGTGVSLFSGVDFPAAPEQGLNGACDFLFARSSEQQFIQSPVIAIVEAKNGVIKSGFGQCIAGMVGASLFNEREGTVVPSIYGVVTIGEIWQFLQLDGPHVRLDSRGYYLGDLPKILGILTWMLAPPGADGSPRIAADDPKGPR